MAKNNILPLVAVAAGMYFIMRKGGGGGDGSLEKGIANAANTAEGYARKITHTIEHGDLLEKHHDYKPQDVGDTLRITGAPAGDYQAVAVYNGDSRAKVVEVHHDPSDNSLYVTALVPGEELPSLLSHGFDTRTSVVNFVGGGSHQLVLVGNIDPQDG